MSKEAIAAFLRRVAQEEALREDFIVFAGQHGFEFSPDEPSDVRLEIVSGGGNEGGRPVYYPSGLTGKGRSEPPHA